MRSCDCPAGSVVKLPGEASRCAFCFEREARASGRSAGHAAGRLEALGEIRDNLVRRIADLREAVPRSQRQRKANRSAARVLEAHVMYLGLEAAITHKAAS